MSRWAANEGARHYQSLRKMMFPSYFATSMLLKILKLIQLLSFGQINDYIPAEILDSTKYDIS